jgi:hypothetical protein
MTGERKIFSHFDEDISDFDNITFGDDSKVWRPRFLINVINANGRISRVKPADTGQT